MSGKQLSLGTSRAVLGEPLHTISLTPPICSSVLVSAMQVSSGNKCKALRLK